MMEYDGDVHISAESQLLDYYAYDRINGSLVIESTDLIALKLPELKEITGDIIITYNEYLKDIRNLDAVTVVEGNIKITHNETLSTKSVQEFVDRIIKDGKLGGKSLVENNLDDEIKDQGTFNGDANISADSDVLMFSSFSKITGKLVVSGLTVNSIDFPILKEVGGDLDISNTSLKTLDGLCQLSQIGGEVAIMDNSSLKDINLENLTNVKKGVTIRDNSVLDSITGLENLEQIGGDLEIVFNVYLSNKEAEKLSEDIDVAGSITVADNEMY
ncbi:MAG: hypothetical protein VYA34_14280 [Myxococcota bacterium]|nr:hypothetical protein [Myxococcota bacterium]